MTSARWEDSIFPLFTGNNFCSILWWEWLAADLRKDKPCFVRYATSLVLAVPLEDGNRSEARHPRRGEATSAVVARRKVKQILLVLLARHGAVPCCSQSRVRCKLWCFCLLQLIDSTPKAATWSAVWCCATINWTRRTNPCDFYHRNRTISLNFEAHTFWQQCQLVSLTSM
jgi:hypothetical protein